MVSSSCPPPVSPSSASPVHRAQHARAQLSLPRDCGEVALGWYLGISLVLLPFFSCLWLPLPPSHMGASCSTGGPAPSVCDPVSPGLSRASAPLWLPMCLFSSCLPALTTITDCQGARIHNRKLFLSTLEAGASEVMMPVLLGFGRKLLLEEGLCQGPDGTTGSTPRTQPLPGTHTHLQWWW